MNPLLQKHKKLVMTVGIVAVCALLGLLRWCQSYSGAPHSTKSAGNEATTEATPSVRAFVCKKTNFTDNLVLTGNLQGGARVELRFNRDGRISKMNYQIGDSVKKGAVIAELETGEANIRLQQAESELSQAVELYRSGAVAKPRLTQVQLAAQLAREEYARSFIRATRDGSIGEVNAEAGETINPQTTVATLVSLETVFIEMGIIEKDLGKLHNGQSVNVEVETYPGVLFHGKIANISPVVEGTSRTRTVRAEIPNEKRTLLPGMFARAKIFIMEKPNVLVVPATALRTSGDENELYVLAGDTAKKTPVKIGYESIDYVEILSGVTDGDRVIAQLTDRIRDGSHVDVVEEISYGEDKKE